MTKIQQAILDIILNSDNHYTAEQIYLLIKQEHPSVAMGTVYRNLNNFAGEKKIRQVKRGEGPDYFEKNLEPHDHIICVNCGNMQDIKIEDLSIFLREKCSYDIISFDLQINYLCEQCSKK